MSKGYLFKFLGLGSLTLILPLIVSCAGKSDGSSVVNTQSSFQIGGAYYHSLHYEYGGGTIAPGSPIHVDIDVDFLTKYAVVRNTYGAGSSCIYAVNMNDPQDARLIDVLKTMIIQKVIYGPEDWIVNGEAFARVVTNAGSTGFIVYKEHLVVGDSYILDATSLWLGIQDVISASSCTVP